MDLDAAALAVARRAQSGATIWCAAPELLRLAAEMAEVLSSAKTAGNRPISTLVIDGPLLDCLRARVSAGDVLVVSARANDPAVVGLRQRAAAWGLLTIWIAPGERPAAGAADYVLCLDEKMDSSCGSPLAAVSQALALGLADYLKHPELVDTEQPECNEEVCITCSDEGRLGEVVALYPDGQAQIRTPVGLETVDTSLIDDAHPGDLVLVHAGSVLSRVEEESL